jgi:hypothetical protein
MLADVMGQAAAGFVDARGAGAQNDTDAVAAVGLDCLVDVFANLQRGFQQQLIITGVLRRKLSRDRRQFALNRGHGQ